MESYKILKVPISKEKAVFYYFKRHENKEALVTLPSDRTIHVCHFVRPLDEGTIQKFFGLAGKIK